MSDKKSDLTIGDGRYIDLHIDVANIHSAFFSICQGAQTPDIEDSIVLAHHVCPQSDAKKTEQARQDLALLMTVHAASFDGNIRSEQPFDLQTEWSNFLEHGQGIDNDQTHKPTDDGRGK